MHTFALFCFAKSTRKLILQFLQDELFHVVLFKKKRILLKMYLSFTKEKTKCINYLNFFLKKGYY